MRLRNRRAVSPIIATLLLIAIAVASGVLVYVFTWSLAGSLMKSGGSQVTDQVSMVAYSFALSPSENLTVYLQNTGTGTVTLASFYFNGAPVVPSGGGATACSKLATPDQMAPGATCRIVLAALSPVPGAGTSNAIRIVSTDGGQFTYNVVAGQTG